MPGKSDRAVVILALGKLDWTNGLPAFKVSETFKRFPLRSGDMLGALYDTPQYFEGNGGGLAHISIWVRTDTTSQ